MARIIVYDGREHPDPDPAATIDQVQNMMSQYYPDMATATCKTEKRGADTLYVFTKRVGTKGSTDLASLILQTPPTELEALSIYEELAGDSGAVDNDKLSAFLSQPGNQERMDAALGQTSRYVSSVNVLHNRLIRNLTE